MFDSIYDNEPVCLNCDDDGCDYCDAVEKARAAEQVDFDDDEWQDFMGGDEDPADYDQFEGNSEW